MISFLRTFVQFFIYHLNEYKVSSSLREIKFDLHHILDRPHTANAEFLFH